MTAKLSSISGSKKEECPFCGHDEHENLIAECGALGYTIGRLEFWDDGCTLAAIEFIKVNEDESDGEAE